MKGKEKHNVDPFDQELRKKASEEHFTFEESAWADLEMQLDATAKAAGKSANHLGRILAISGIVIGSSILAALGIYQYSSPSENNVSGSSIEKEDKSALSAPLSAKDLTVTDKFSSERKNIGLPNQSRAEQNTTSFESTNSQTSRSSHEQKNSAQEQNKAENVNVSGSVNGAPGNDGVLNHQELAASGPNRKISGKNQPSKTPLNGQKEGTSKEKESSENNVILLQEQLFQKASGLNLSQVELSPLNINTTELSFIESGGLNEGEGLIDLPKEQQEAKKWGTLLQVSAGFQKFTDGPSSFNGNPLVYGLQVGKIYNNAISFNLGINWFSTSFTTNSAQFQADQKFWPEGILPSKITGAVKGIEVPVVLGLHFPQLNGSNFLQFGVQGGLNSVLFSSEKYYFTYDNANPTLVENLEGKWQSKNWFQMLHFGLAVKTKLTSYANLGVLPYVNIPLGGLGFGNMTYSNYSLQFNLEIKL